MRTFLIVLVLIVQCKISVSQSFAVGNSTITLTDQTRNRSIPVQVYYPSETGGQNAPWANETFPLILLGHGFAMNVSAYVNFCEYIVPEGYAVGMIDTENGLFSVSHGDYAQDFVYVAQNLNLPGIQNQPVAFLGHSMGGGAAFLAAEIWSPDLLVGWAPAETNPSSIAAAGSVQCPLVVFSGSGDAVTPPETNHLPMYNNASSACKAFISILGGAHCYFAQSSFTCDFGETTAGSEISITRAEQQALVFSRMRLLLNAFLKQNQSDFEAFEESVVNATEVDGIWQCNEIPLKVQLSQKKQQIQCLQTDVPGIFRVLHPAEGRTNYLIVDVNGRVVQQGFVDGKSGLVNLTTISSGLYFIHLSGNSAKLILNR